MSTNKTTSTMVITLVGLIAGFCGCFFNFFGVLWVWAAFGPQEASPGGRLTQGIVMLIVGLLIWAGAAVGIYLLWRRMQPPPEQKITVEQKIDLTGEVELEKLKCRNCGAELDKSSITVAEGAVVVSCPYCGASYQIVEEPKW
jgi:DNA-directed RNA polymerase subunit RPC12/RpoP